MTQVPVWMVLMVAFLALITAGSAIGGRVYDTYYGPDIEFTTQPLETLPAGVYVVHQQKLKAGIFRYLLISISNEEPRIYPIRSKDRLPRAFEAKCENDEVRIEPRNIRINIHHQAEEAPGGPVT